MSKKIKEKKIASNNYKIESLEPRFMMDAAIDYAQFVDNYDQVDSIVEMQLDNLQMSGLGLSAVGSASLGVAA